MTSKNLYIDFCRTHQLPIYMQPWWLDSVCCTPGKSWEAIVLCRASGEVVAAAPFHILQKYCFRLITNAQLTPHQGFWLSADLSDSERSALIEQLASELSVQKVDAIWFNVEKDFPFGASLESQGFARRDHFTYAIRRITEPDELLHRCHQMKRRQGLKARKSLHTEVNALAPASFYDFYSQCLAQRGKQVNYRRDFFLTMARAALEHEAGAFFSVVDSESRLYAVLFCVWDEQCAYALTYAIDHELRNSGASALMMHDAICYLRDKTRVFDFEGGNDPQIGASYSKFASERIDCPCFAKHLTLKGKILRKIIFKP